MTSRELSGLENTFWRSAVSTGDTLSALSSDAVDDSTFRLLADNIPTLCWIANGDGYIVWYNRRWHDYCGTTPDQMEGWGWQSVHDPERLPSVMERWAGSIATGDAFEMTFPLRGADGVFRPFLTRIQPVRDASGNVARWFGVNTEVSGQVGAEQALAVERDLLRGVLEAVPGVIYAKDRDGRMIVANRGTEGLIGKRPADFIGKTDAEFLDDKDQAEVVMANDRRIMDSGHGEALEEVIYLPNGTPATWFSTKVPWRDRDGNIVGLIGASVDVTDEVKAREVLARSRDELEMEVARRTEERDRLWRTTQDLLLIARYDGTITDVNPAWQAMLGWPEMELTGSSFMTLIHPDDLAASAAEAERISAEGRSTSQFENRYRRKDGSWVWLSWAVTSENGLFHAVARDISEQKLRAAELELAQDQLRQAQKMEAIGQLTGGVAHDFNNLLTIIRSSTDLLRRPELPEDKRRRYIDAISDTSDRAAALTSQLLAFARRQPLKPEHFDVVERLEQTANILRSTLGGLIQFEIDVLCEDCEVEADLNQFDTSILNLVVNARDAMNGNGRLTIVVDDVESIPERRGHAAQTGHFVAVSVSDEGSGIAREQIDRIFEPFFTTKEVGKGTGLGLSQVIGFAKQSGGDIFVESVPKQGTTFTLYLPRAEPCLTKKATGPIAEPIEPPPEGRCVLVVEDNQTVGEFAARLLEELGYATRWASDGQTALDLLAEHPDLFNLVFSDVVMPGISGLELAKRIRRDHPSLPVVLTSGYSHVMAEEGTHGFMLLRKPYSVEALARILQTAAQSS